MSPMPLPIEMFCRKICSTMPQSTVAISDGGSPESVLSRIAASALAEMPEGFSTAKYNFSVPSGCFRAQTYASDSHCGTWCDVGKGRVATDDGTSLNWSAYDNSMLVRSAGSNIWNMSMTW